MIDNCHCHRPDYSPSVDICKCPADCIHCRGSKLVEEKPNNLPEILEEKKRGRPRKFSKEIKKTIMVKSRREKPQYGKKGEWRKLLNQQ